MSVTVHMQAGRRIGSRLASAAAAGAVGLSAWLVIDHHPVLAGVAALAAGALMIAAAVVARAPGVALERALDSVVDRAFDGAILAALAWAYRWSDAPVAAGALVALGASFLAAYIRARGASLGYGVDESLATRALRYGLVSVGLLTGGLRWTLWTVAALMTIASVVRASQVAKEERT
jgi:hypothetical protein